MVPLLARSFPEITCLPADDSAQTSTAAGDFDCHAPLADLGRWLRPDADSFVPTKAYLAADPERNATLRGRYLEKTGGILAGLAWISKSPHYAGWKSMTLDDLELVLGIPGVTFVDLQYGDTGEERAGFYRPHRYLHHPRRQRRSNGRSGRLRRASGGAGHRGDDFQYDSPHGRWFEGGDIADG